MYHTHADRTFGALVERYCGGSKMGSAIGMYAVPKMIRTTDIEHCTERSDIRTVAAWRKFASSGAPVTNFEGVLERTFEK